MKHVSVAYHVVDCHYGAAHLRLLFDAQRGVLDFRDAGRPRAAKNQPTLETCLRDLPPFLEVEASFR